MAVPPQQGVGCDTEPGTGTGTQLMLCLLQGRFTHNSCWWAGEDTGKGTQTDVLPSQPTTVLTFCLFLLYLAANSAWGEHLAAIPQDTSHTLLPRSSTNKIWLLEWSHLDYTGNQITS